MKISNRTNPVLGFLENDFIGELKVPMSINKQYVPILKEVFQYSWPKLRHKFASNVIYVSESFVDAADLATPKMREYENEFTLDEGEYCGTFLVKRLAICYSFKLWYDEDGGQNISLDIFTFKDNCVISIYSTFSEDRKNSTFQFYNDLDDSGCFYAGEAMDKILSNWFWITRIWILFKKYAQVETKYLPAGQKLKTIDVKYVNETHSNVTILDSTWFTNLVKSDGFKVRGHFRLQPKKKEGRWTKEIIWIDKFDKEGYTTKAKKLNTI